MRRLLLDTNVVIWLLLRLQDRIPPSVVATLEDRDASIAVSVVCPWEIAMKRSIGKLDIEGSWSSALGALGFTSMPITASHAVAVQDLPWHHRDPFDRMLIAQSMVERCALVTADARLSAYDIETVWG